MSLMPLTHFEKNYMRQASGKVMRLYDEEGNVCVIFSQTNCRFGLTCDFWKSLTQDYYICITCHWIGSNCIL